MTLGVDAQVHRRLAPAFADRLQFDEGIGEGEESGRTGEELALEIGAQTIAEDRNR